MTWNIKYNKKIAKTYVSATMLIGLPGMANVGKISADYLVAELKADLFATITSDRGPAFSLISEKNLVVMPNIEIYHKKINKKDFFFVVGDYQPVSDVQSFALSKTIVDVAKKLSVKQIYTLGGIGLEEEPEKPKVYATANNSKFLKFLKEKKFKTDVYMTVGVIMGITGLVVGLAKTDSASLLAETSSFQGYIGLNSAKYLLKSLNKLFDFGINFKNLNKEIKTIEKLSEEIKSLQKEQVQLGKKGDVNYIG